MSLVSPLPPAPSLRTDVSVSRPAPAAAEPIVSIHDVTLHFGEKPLFDHLDLAVVKKERLVIMGMSGTGKSVLLKMLAGTYLPEHGSIRLFGHEITHLSDKPLNALRKRLALVFQYGALFSSLTVRENLSLALEELTEKSRDEIDAIVMEKLRYVGLPHTAHMMPYELSGGMQKRVSIARALVLEPELLLFDEPTAGLDPISSKVIDDLILRLNQETHVTEIMIGHKMENAFRVATRIAILNDGRIIAEGTPDEIRSSRVPLVMQFVANLTKVASPHGPWGEVPENFRA